MYGRLPRMPGFEEMLVHEERHLVAAYADVRPGRPQYLTSGLRVPPACRPYGRLGAADSRSAKHRTYSPRSVAPQVAINKPAGLLSQRDHTGEASAICMAAEWLASTDRRGRAHLVHRLDRRVSGLLLIARSTKAASRLSQSFARRDVLKSYLALCDRSARAPALAEGAEGQVAALPWFTSQARSWRLRVIAHDVRSFHPGQVAATLRFDPKQGRAVRVPVASAGDDGARSVSLGYSVLGVADGHALRA